MKTLGLRTICCMYHILIVLFGMMLSCDSVPAFDWAGIKNQYATRDDEITDQDVAMPGVIPTEVRFFSFVLCVKGGCAHFDMCSF